MITVLIIIASDMLFAIYLWLAIANNLRRHSVIISTTAYVTLWHLRLGGRHGATDHMFPFVPDVARECGIYVLPLHHSGIIILPGKVN